MKGSAVSSRNPSPEKKSSTPIRDRAVQLAAGVTQERISSNLELQRQRSIVEPVSPPSQFARLPSTSDLTPRQLEKLPAYSFIPGSFEQQDLEEERDSAEVFSHHAEELEQVAVEQLLDPEYSDPEDTQRIEELHSAFEELTIKLEIGKGRK